MAAPQDDSYSCASSQAIRGGKWYVPTWRRGLQVNVWSQIANTRLSISTALDAQIAAGLTNGSYGNIGYGNPRKGILDYSGAALRRSGSEILIMGGGGAGAWGGNDVRGIRLGDDAPAWATRVAPSNASALWTSGHPSSEAYMQDGKPNARHAYNQHIFVDATDTLMMFGCQNTWEHDSGTFLNVDSAPLATGVWNAAGAHPDLPASRGVDSSWNVKHPTTEHVYASMANRVSKWDRSANTWSNLYLNAGQSGIDRGTAEIDPVRNIILRIGTWDAGTKTPITIGLDTGACTVATLMGPHAADITSALAAGICYEPALDCFLWFQDDGYIYTIAHVSDSSYYVDRLALSGAPPPAGHSGALHSGGACAIWGRFRYCPELQGVALIQASDTDIYFVRTH